MVRVNYGDCVTPETCAKLVGLFKGEPSLFRTGVSEEVISELASIPGEKVLEIVNGRSVEEATRCLPDNRGERIKGAVVLLKVRSEVDFLPIDMARLIRYFDVYPNDPKITWGFCSASSQEDPVNIIILKNITK